MSIIRCKWCDREIDTDFDESHEEECELNIKDKEDEKR